MPVSQIISYAFGVIGVVIGIYQIIQTYSLKQHIKTEALGTYLTTSLLLGKTQSCLEDIKNGDTPTSIQEAGRAEGIAQTLLIESAKNIHHHFKFTRKDLDVWINNGKVHEYHKGVFLSFAEK